MFSNTKSKKTDFTSKQNTQQKRMARRVVLSDIIEKTRKDVIYSDLMVGFFEHLLKKEDVENLGCDRCQVEEFLRREKNSYDFNLEKLTYFKNLRSDIIAKKALNDIDKFPNEIYNY